MKKIITKRELINKDKAAKMLKKNNMNRRISTTQVDRYAQAMLSGEWVENGQTISVAEDGTLLDGQHRLLAVIKSGVAIYFLIVYNIPKDAMATIDAGFVRTLAHVLDIKKVANSRHAATITKHLYIHDVADAEMRWRNCKDTQRNALLENFYNANSKSINEATAMACSSRHHFNISHMGLCYVIFARKNPAKADVFFHLVKTGENLPAKHPVIALRAKLMDNRISKDKLSVRETTALYIKSWNAFIKGKTLVNFRWNSTEDLPEVL